MFKKIFICLLLFTNLSFGVNNNIQKEQDTNIEKELPQAPISERTQKVFDYYNLKELTKPKVDETTDHTFRDKFRAIATNSNLIATALDLTRSRAKSLEEGTLDKYIKIPFNDYSLAQVIAKESVEFRDYISKVNIVDWEDYELSTRYFKEKQKDKEILNDIQTLILVPTMLIASIIDINVFLIILLIQGTRIKTYIKKLFEDFSIGGKIKLTILSLAIGILYSVIFASMHQSITGIENPYQLNYVLILGAILLPIIALFYNYNLSKKEDEKIAYQYNTVFTKNMLSYNTDLEKKILNQDSATEVEHITITMFLLGFFGYLYLTKGGKNELLANKLGYSEEKLLNEIEKLGFKNIYDFLENYTDWKTNYIENIIVSLEEIKIKRLQIFSQFINLGFNVGFNLFQEDKHNLGKALEKLGYPISSKETAIELLKDFNILLDELKNS